MAPNTPSARSWPPILIVCRVAITPEDGLRRAKTVGTLPFPAHSEVEGTTPHTVCFTAKVVLVILPRALLPSRNILKRMPPRFRMVSSRSCGRTPRDLYRPGLPCRFQARRRTNTHGGQICLPGFRSYHTDSVLPRYRLPGHGQYHNMPATRPSASDRASLPYAQLLPEIITHHLQAA